jgi:hypothetical protein
MDKFTRITLKILLSFMALNAFGGGSYGMLGAKGVPTEWLKETPFNTYFIPGLLLFTLVGGTNFIAFIMLLRSSQYSREAAFLSGAVLVIWIIIQLLMIGYVSWLQPVVFLTGITILLLTCLFLKK